MNEDRQILLKKINDLIDKRKVGLLHRIPCVHEIDDGILIRFFTDWGECEINNGIRFKKIINEKDSNDITIFYFIPKGTMLEKTPRDYINTIICISGKVKLDMDKEVFYLNGSKKININKAEFEATAIEDSYLITLNK